MPPLASALVLLLSTAATTDRPEVPHLLGLGASVGVFGNNAGAALHVRVSGELTFYTRPLNDLVALVQVGTAAAVVRPSNPPITEHYQHVAMAGFGYRSNHALLTWGFQLALGALWYRSAFSDTYVFENRVLLYSEGRAQIGLKLAPSLRAGLYLGYGSPVVYSVRHPGSFLAGGVMVGLYLDWR